MPNDEIKIKRYEQIEHIMKNCRNALEDINSEFSSVEFKRISIEYVLSQASHVCLVLEGKEDA